MSTADYFNSPRVNGSDMFNLTGNSQRAVNGAENRPDPENGALRAKLASTQVSFCYETILSG